MENEFEVLETEMDEFEDDFEEDLSYQYEGIEYNEDGDAFDFGDIVMVRAHTQEEKDNYPVMGWSDQMSEMEGKIFLVEDCEYNQVFLMYDAATWGFDARSVVLVAREDDATSDQIKEAKANRGFILYA